MAPPREERLTAIFAKHPTPGAVKTRLCPPLAPREAAHLAEAMLRDGVARARAGTFRTALVFAPAERAGWFQGAFPEVEEQWPQVGAGLGQRLAHHVARVFERGLARTLVIVGSDQPLVPLARLEEAHARLEEGADCVLGPDLGGGYYLVGLRRSVPELFTEVRMSSADMAAATLRLARARGLSVAELPAHPDVDLPADLEHLRAALAARADLPFVDHTRRALAELALPTP
ncbi:MAG TPA: TIGR04282 family arsenosugar biosynthesis glycosyltransferase [Planctomycetota bacterium]